MNKLILNTKLKTVAAVCATIFLTACGGGGGGGGGSSPDWNSTPTAPGVSNTGSADTPDTPEPDKPGFGNNCKGYALCVADHLKPDSTENAPAPNLNINPVAGELPPVLNGYPEANPRLNFNDLTRYKNAINLKTAHDLGYKGKGAVVGVVDDDISDYAELFGSATRISYGCSGHQAGISELDRLACPGIVSDGTEDMNIDPAYLTVKVRPFDVYDNAKLNRVFRDFENPTFQHGAPHSDTLNHMDIVSYLLAGRAVPGYGTGGVAPEAKLVGYDVRDKFDEKNIIEGWQYAISKGAKIINNSYGVSNVRNDDEYSYSPPNVSDLEHVAQFNMTADSPSFRKMDEHIRKDGTLFVFAAGNDGLTYGSYEGLLPYAYPKAQKGLIVAAGVENDGTIAKSSNRCGLMAQWCLSAPYQPGVLFKGRQYVDALDKNMVIRGSNDEPLLGLGGRGTSFSAPLVSGTAALVLGRYPWMSNDNLRTTILTTAQDIGAKGVDSVYGWGLLNAGKAVKGPAQFAFGMFDANVTGEDTVSFFENDISGNGGLNKTGDGRLILDGENTYTGVTNVMGGMLSVNKSITSDVYSGSKFHLNDNARVKGNVQVDVNGFLFGGNNSTIDGNLTFTQNGNLFVQLGDVLNVTGKTEFGDTGGIWLGGVSKYYARPNERLITFLRSEGGITAKDGQVQRVYADGEMVSRDNVGTATGKDLYYSLRRNNVNTVAMTVKERLDPVLAHNVVQGGRNLENLMEEADKLSDKELATGSYAQTGRLLIRAQSERTDGTATMLEQLAAGVHANSTNVFAETQSRRLKSTADKLDRPLKTGETDVFAETKRDTGDWKHGAASGGLTDFRQTLGVKYQAGEQTTLAAAFDAGQTKWDENTRGSAAVNSFGLNAGVRHNLDNMTFVKALLGYSGYKNKTARLNGVDIRAEGEAEGSLTQAALLSGFRLPVFGSGLLETEIGTRLDILRQKAFEEKGGALAWKADKLSETTPVGLLNVRLTQPLNDKTALFGFAGVEHDFKKRDYALTGMFKGANQARGKTGAWDMPQTRWNAGLGIRAELGRGWSAFGNYEHTGSSRYKSNSLKAGVGYRF